MASSFIESCSLLARLSSDPSYDHFIARQAFDPDSTLELTKKLSKQLQDIVDNSLTPEQEVAYGHHFRKSLAHMIYGSNLIEKVGAGFDVTYDLCMQTFEGKEVPRSYLMDLDGKEYHGIEAYLQEEGLPTDIRTISQHYNEITQHARAAIFMYQTLCAKGLPLSERLICEAHHILSYTVDSERAPWYYYAGRYRTVDVTAGPDSFATVSSIPGKMRDMIKQLQYDIKKAEESGYVDPIMLAAKYSHIFFNIHPFLDGNGRMCRLILNTLLLKFGGFVVCLGEDEAARDTYLEVSASGSLLEFAYEGLEEEEKPVMHKELASLVLSHVPATLEGLIKAVTTCD